MAPLRHEAVRHRLMCSNRRVVAVVITTYSAPHETLERCVRAVLALEWARDPAGVLEMTVTADAFCHSMVRSLVGALLTVGEGRRQPDWPGTLLSRRERVSDVPVVAPHGLCLEAVGYPPDEELAERQLVTRRLRVPQA